MLNRCVLIVKKKEPFLDWLQSLPDPVTDSTLDDLNEDVHAYLLQDYEMDDEKEKILAHFYDIIFEEELGGWWTLKNDWPKNRSVTMFKKWFSYEFHSIVLDLLRDPLVDDERDPCG